MARTLLLRGMLAGLIAGLIVFASARWVGEPHVERAIAFEAGMDARKGEPAEAEMVSRRTQKNAGLLIGVLGYTVALGGLFGLAFAYAQGRLNQSRPRALSLLLAALGFTAITLTPSLKYPANPPSVGSPETIGVRTAAYFLLILLSVVIMTVAIKAWQRWRRSLGDWNAALSAGLFYIVAACVCAHLLPAIDEVPPEFPASLLWNFRIASWEIQAVMWASLGLIFGWLTERAEHAADGRGRFDSVEEPPCL